jgi:hypothetical protein
MTDRHLGHLQAVAIFSRVLARSSETPEPFTPTHRVDVCFVRTAVHFREFGP